MMMAINRTRGTAIGGALFVSLLISGNSVSTVEANCLTDKYTEIIRSDTAEICQTYTIKRVWIILYLDIICIRQKIWVLKM